MTDNFISHHLCRANGDGEVFNLVVLSCITKAAYLTSDKKLVAQLKKIFGRIDIYAERHFLVSERGNEICSQAVGFA